MIETLGKNWVWLLLDLDLGLGSWLSVCGVRRWLCAPGMPRPSPAQPSFAFTIVHSLFGAPRIFCIASLLHHCFLQSFLLPRTNASIRFYLFHLFFFLDGLIRTHLKF